MLWDNSTGICCINVLFQKFKSNHRTHDFLLKAIIFIFIKQHMDQLQGAESPVHL